MSGSCVTSPTNRFLSTAPPRTSRTEQPDRSWALRGRREIPGSGSGETTPGGGSALRPVGRQPVVGVGKVDSCGTHLVEVRAVPRDGVGQVDDVENLRAAEAGDLNRPHHGEARALRASDGPRVGGAL